MILMTADGSVNPPSLLHAEQWETVNASGCFENSVRIMGGLADFSGGQIILGMWAGSFHQGGRDIAQQVK